MCHTTRRGIENHLRQGTIFTIRANYFASKTKLLHFGDQGCFTHRVILVPTFLGLRSTMLDEFDKSTLYLIQSLTRSTTHDKHGAWRPQGSPLRSLPEAIVSRQATPLRLLLPLNLCRPRPSMRKSRGTTTRKMMTNSTTTTIITMGAKRERSVAITTVTSSAMLIPMLAMPAVLAVEARRVAALIVGAMPACVLPH